MTASAWITNDFLLGTPAARRLYWDFASTAPIVDYHCHLSPADIACDRRYENLTQAWLAGDHYKWRAMRAAGIGERFITGSATDREKFDAWASVVPRTLRNPLYHWTHLELKRIFGIDELLGPDTAQTIWLRCNEKLASPEFSCRGLIRRWNVRLLCTTDDPADSLEFHRALANDKSFDVRVLPAWRADSALAVEDPAGFNAWVQRLARSAGREISNYSDLREALAERHEFFHAAGCRISDCGLTTPCAEDCTERDAQAVFAKVRSGARPDGLEAAKYRSALLLDLAGMDASRGWAQQYHLGILRNVNSRAHEAIGPDTGFDAIGGFAIGQPLARMLDRFNRAGCLSRTIVYNANPSDTEMLASILGAFQDGSVPGKFQLGTAWWFLDNLDGMRRQLEALSQMGLLSLFVGMVTDSRSFLSYPRHEYFRRLLCDLLGREMEQGLLPDNRSLVGGLVADICYNNAVRYFGFDLAPHCPQTAS